MATEKPDHTQALYEMVVLLFTLDPVRGIRLVPGMSDGVIDNTLAWRSFVDSIAYISARKAGGDYVVAAAIQKTTTGMTVWLAGNEEIEAGVGEFLRSLLQDLTESARLTKGTSTPKAHSINIGTISSRIIEFVSDKLQKYYEKAMKLIPSCSRVIEADLARGCLAKADADNLAALQACLEKKFAHKTSDTSRLGKKELETLVGDCNDLRSRHVEAFEYANVPGKHGYQDFLRLYKAIGKLGKPISITTALFRATRIFAADFAQGFEVSITESQGIRPVEDFTFEQAMNSTFSLEEKEKYLQRLQFLKPKALTSKRLKEKIKLKTCVHAELILVDLFFKNKYKFAARDNYIACSKPACYLCYLAIIHHHKTFTNLPVHQKIYRNWRAPDVDPGDSERVKFWEEILSRVADKVKIDLFDEIDSDEPLRYPHADSPGR